MEVKRWDVGGQGVVESRAGEVKGSGVKGWWGQGVVGSRGGWVKGWLGQGVVGSRGGRVKGWGDGDGGH